MRKQTLVIGCILAAYAIPAVAGWSTSFSKDEMTGEQSGYATSPKIEPTKTMRFPYHDTKAWLGVGCDGKDEWAYIGFSNAPNLNDTDTEDGYNRIFTRIKWGNREAENVTLIQEWGAAFAHFYDDETAISNIARTTSVLVELN